MLKRNALLRLFGSAREVIAKAENDLARLREALAVGRQTDALWALMDCSITVFHIGDWIRTTHTDHRRASSELATASRPIRMTRDVCHAAKHGDLTWKNEDTDLHGPILAKLEYIDDDQGGIPRHQIIAIDQDGRRHDVVEVVSGAISEWSHFANERSL